MKITYVENVRLPTTWAHGYQIMRTCEAMVGAGASVDLVVPTRRPEGPQADPFLAYGVGRTFTLRRVPCLDLVPMHPTPLEPALFWLSRQSFFRKMGRVRVLDGADWGFARDPATVAALLRAFPKARICMEVHDDPRGNAARWQTVRSGVHAWVAISAGVRDMLVGEGVPADAVCVAPDGFSPDEFVRLPSRAEARKALGIADDALLFVYTGQLLPWKGLDGIAPAFRSLPPGAALAIVGGQEEDRARIRAAAGGDLPQVRFVPHQPRGKAHVWLAAGDAAVLPTSAGFEIGRSFSSPIKLFEYLAAGLPIIASDVPTSREILTETEALFFRPDDPGSFAAAAARFAALSPAQRAAMAAAAREKSAAYTWHARGERIVRFLNAR